MYFTFSESNRTFQSLGTWTSQKANVTGLAKPEQVNVVLVTDGVLEALGVPPLTGRELTAADQAPNGAKNVMVSYGYWQRRFGGDRSVISRTIVIDSQAHDCRCHAARLPRRRSRLRCPYTVRVRA